jgi:hypothetical protein
MAHLSPRGFVLVFSACKQWSFVQELEILEGYDLSIPTKDELGVKDIFFSCKHALIRWEFFCDFMVFRCELERD